MQCENDVISTVNYVGILIKNKGQQPSLQVRYNLMILYALFLLKQYYGIYSRLWLWKF